MATTNVAGTGNENLLPRALKRKYILIFFLSHKSPSVQQRHTSSMLKILLRPIHIEAKAEAKAKIVFDVCCFFL